MNNTTLIVNAALNAGIFTEAEIEQHLEQSGEIPLHTFKGWKERGYSVLKGQKAALKCDIWKRSKKVETVQTKTQDGQQAEQDIDASRYYKKLSHFFTAEQVERVQITKEVAQ